MTIERARKHTVLKPWGAADVRPWATPVPGGAVGEIWYERSDLAERLPRLSLADAQSEAQQPALLLKMLFTSKPLSIQIHPDDTFAKRLGLANGKSEAWYIVAAKPGAQVTTRLKRTLSPDELRRSVQDGSIGALMDWRDVTAGDVVYVPAGTIHAIGPGLVIAEIQQRSDATFRLFDYGSDRELHVERGIEAASVSPVSARIVHDRPGPGRVARVESAHFVLEEIVVPPGASWGVDTDRETWLLVLEGCADAGAQVLSAGDALFADGGPLELRTHHEGMKGLLAYVPCDTHRRLSSRTANEPFENNSCRSATKAAFARS